MNNGLRSSIRISTIPQLSPDLDRVLVEVRLPDDSQMHVIVEYLFRVTKSEIDDLQWYFEKFLEFDEEPAPTIARGIEKHLHDRGSELFCSVLDGNEQVRALWRAFQPHIADADFELVRGQARRFTGNSYASLRLTGRFRCACIPLCTYQSWPFHLCLLLPMRRQANWRSISD